MNLIEVDRALRQLRLGGMGVWFPTNSLYAPTVYSNAAANRPPFATPTGLSITSTSLSIQK